MFETLYRSPSVIINEFEWRVETVRSVSGQRKAIVNYYFRPLVVKPGHWAPITDWVGQRPKRLHNRMQAFYKHARLAQCNDQLRAFAVKRLAEAAA